MRITVQNRFGILGLFLVVIVGLIADNDRHYQVESKIKALEKKLIVTNRVNSSLTKELSQVKAVKLNPLVDPALIEAVIEVESGGNEKAYNSATGAVGKMQLTPVIYKGLCGLTKVQAFDPKRNVACGTLFLGHLLKRYRGDTQKALLFYNNGYIIKNQEYDDKVLLAIKNKEKK